MRKLLGSIALLFPLIVNAGSILEGKISLIHTNTILSENAQAVGFTEFGLKDKSFDSPCGYVYIQSEDSNVLSLLLSAQAQDKMVKVHYRPDVPAPWAPGSCAVSAVSISN